MAGKLNLTDELVRIVLALRRCKRGEIYGLELHRLSGCTSTTVYNRLRTFEALGWMESRPEESSRHVGMKPRVFYTVTPTGVTEFSRLIDRIVRTPRFNDIVLADWYALRVEER